MDIRKEDEIDFIKLLKQPLRLFGMSYFYFLLAGGVVGASYILNFNQIGRNNITPQILTDSSQFDTDIALQRGAIIAPVNVTEAAKPTKESINRGAILFKQNCVSCHGDDGRGDGVSAASMKVKPRNFHLSTGWRFGRKISQMYTTLQKGIPESGMPAFNYTPPADRFAIINYVRTFANDFPVDSLSDLLNLEKTYNLSKGEQLPAHIPVEMAMQKILGEDSNKVTMVDHFTESMMNKNSAQEDRGAKIAMEVSKDPQKMVAAAMAAQGRSLDDFIKTVESDPVMIGFKVEVLRLSSDEWSALYSFLSKVNREKQG
jgi:mono/diheme cytochrome c family protein/uncharacterized protein (DUF1778 family)